MVDSAEIPTRQELPSVDTNGDGVVSTREGEVSAADQCGQLSRAITADVDGVPLRFAVRTAAVGYPPGEAGLATTRLVCELTAPADLGAAATLSFQDTFRDGRIGWREITAVGVDIGLPHSPVPVSSRTRIRRSAACSTSPSPRLPLHRPGAGRHRRGAAGAALLHRARAQALLRRSSPHRDRPAVGAALPAAGRRSRPRRTAARLAILGR